MPIFANLFTVVLGKCKDSGSYKKEWISNFFIDVYFMKSTAKVLFNTKLVNANKALTVQVGCKKLKRIEKRTIDTQY